ncbi:MAG: malate synthase A [Chloroflexota bacterium]|nr:malate synthase A [Chloroflexota bacterium]
MSKQSGQTVKPASHPAGVEVTGPLSQEYAEILTPEALAFIAGLAREFEPRRRELLRRRQEVQARIDEGWTPDFPVDTAGVRHDAWTCSPLPTDLLDRRVEITGPTDRKMMINALNSGASVFMADFEDSLSPTWDNVVGGQVTLRDAVKRNITFTSPEGKEYRLNDSTAVLFVRPRGWHLAEKHLLVDGAEISASLFDFGLAFFHNARNLMDRGTGPYYYLPKLENHLEARLWNDVFLRVQEQLGIPRGTIRATVLIETILASFEEDEILWELREHSSGLNCGRWDYIFSIIKKFRNRPGFLMPDRAAVTMGTDMMHSYSLMTIKTCHHRETDAIGGMAAFIPVKNDPEVNEQAIAQVVIDKRREAGDGHDGTWVAHPGLVPVALEIFDELMPQPNQIERKREDVQVTARDLLTVPSGAITEAGLRLNVNVGIQYLESWLRGQGAAAINNLMEDAATAEISRAQIWQWIHEKASLDDGRPITTGMIERIISEELDKISTVIGRQQFQAGKFDLATKIFQEVAIDDQWHDFLTTVAYPYLP